MTGDEEAEPFKPRYEPISSDEEEPPSIPPPSMRYPPNTKFMSNLDLLAEIAFGIQLYEASKVARSKTAEASNPSIIDERRSSLTAAAANREANNNNETKILGINGAKQKETVEQLRKSETMSKTQCQIIQRSPQIEIGPVLELSVDNKHAQKRKYAGKNTTHVSQNTLQNDVAAEVMEAPTRNRKELKRESNTTGTEQTQKGQNTSTLENVSYRNSQFQRISKENVKNLPNNIRLHVPLDLGLGNPNDLAYTDFSNQNQGHGSLVRVPNGLAISNVSNNIQNYRNGGLGNPNDLAFTIFDDKNPNGKGQSERRPSPRSSRGNVYLPFMPKPTSRSEPPRFSPPTPQTRGMYKAARISSPVPLGPQNQGHRLPHGKEHYCEGDLRRCIGEIQHFSFAGAAPVTFSGLRESRCIIKLGQRPWPNLEIAVELDWRKAPILAANFHGLTAGRPVYTVDKREVFFGAKQLDWATGGGRLKGLTFERITPKFIQFSQDGESDLLGYSSFISIPEWNNDENNLKGRNRILKFDVNRRSKTDNLLFDGAVVMNRVAGQGGMGSSFMICMLSSEDTQFSMGPLGLVFGKVVEGLDDLKEAAKNKVGVKGKVLGSALRPISSDKKVYFLPAGEG